MQKFSLSAFSFQLIFWLLVGFGTYYYMLADKSDSQQSLILTAAVIPIIMGTSYFLTYYLIPNYLLKGRKLRFFLYLFYTLTASFYLSLMVLLFIFITWANFNYDGLPAVLKNRFSFFVFIHLIVLIFVALNAMINWYRLQNSYLTAMKEKETAELKFLKTQLQPHFLFNTLNNLYYLTLHKSDQAPEVVMKLSHLLDYVLNSSKNELELLATEWEKLQDYCYLESLRYADRLAMTLQKNDILPTAKIPPLMLITLAENCFKHGVMPTTELAFIRIELSAIGSHHQVIFENSLTQKQQSTAKSFEIGLNNMRQQLRHYYGENYSLSSKASESKFSIELSWPQV